MPPDSAPDSQTPSISFQTDDWDVYRNLGVYLLLGIFVAGVAILKHRPWIDVILVGSFFLLSAVGGYLFLRRGVLGRRYVMTPEGISSTCDGHPSETFLWRDVARVEKLQIIVRTHDGRRVSFYVPRTLERTTLD